MLQLLMLCIWNANGLCLHAQKITSTSFLFLKRILTKKVISIQNTLYHTDHPDDSAHKRQHQSSRKLLQKIPLNNSSNRQDNDNNKYISRLLPSQAYQERIIFQLLLNSTHNRFLAAGNFIVKHEVQELLKCLQLCNHLSTCQTTYRPTGRRKHQI